MVQFLQFLSEYRLFFMFILIVLLAVALYITFTALVNRIKKGYDEQQREENKLKLRNIDYNGLGDEQKISVLRRAIASSNVDPGPNGYLIIEDKGIEAYVRVFYLSVCSKRVNFNGTFKGLMNFPNCISDVKIRPISAATMSRKIDKNLVDLETEYIASEGNTNKQRKLKGKYAEKEQMALEVESGDQKYFHALFKFALVADSVEKLNRMTAEFNNIAVRDGLTLSSCYGAQAEAYADMMPLNDAVPHRSKYIDGAPEKKITFNRHSASTVFNYSEGTFSHKAGIPLGRHLFTGLPFVFDLYDASHDGFLAIIAGKTGSGKSVTIKVMCERYALQGYRFVAIDSQQKSGTSEGEYAALAEILGGANYQISNRSKNKLNPFHVSESLVYESEMGIRGEGVRTLDLADKISQLTTDIFSLICGENELKDDALLNYMPSLIEKACYSCYAERGIYDKQPDSLYEVGDVIVNGRLTSGMVAKELPTICDFYKKILVQQKANVNRELVRAYEMIVQGMSKYVEELYYTENSRTFLTREQYEACEASKKVVGGKVWRTADDDIEEIIEVHGSAPYFDGQSTFAISQECVFTNIDISLLNEKDKAIARQIAVSFMNENFIKKNSENKHVASKLMFIVDEAHESFKYPYARQAFENVVRTMRKRNVSGIFSTQTVREFDDYKETRNILKQAAVKMICKQDPQDREWLIKNLDITPAQARVLTQDIGYNDNDDEAAKNAHRGEMCVIDNRNVSFIKVDMIFKTEGLSAETNAAKLAEMYNRVA